MYRPTTFFLTASGILSVLGLIPFLRFFYYLWFTADGGGSRHLQSLIVGSVLLVAAFLSLALAVIADLIRINRVLIEDTLEQQKRRAWPATDAPPAVRPAPVAHDRSP
jgi:hypothetical protein